MTDLKKNDLTLIERCIRTPASYTYAPCARGGTHSKLVRSNLSSSQIKNLHRLAVDGYLAEKWGGCGGRNDPPEHTLTFTVTALGRDAVGVRVPIKPPVNISRPATDSQLLAEANRRD